MLRRDLTAAACGLLATLTVAICVWPSASPAPSGPALTRSPTPTHVASAPTPAPAPAPAPAPTPAAPGEPVGPAPAPVEPADPTGAEGELLAADPVEDAKVHARWQGRLAREDEQLVRQAVSAGCDASRADRMRDVLAAKRAARAETIAERTAGRITAAELATRAKATKREADAALRALLTPGELAALDPEGARASIIDPTERP